MRRWPRLSLGLLVGATTALAACNSILGVEEIATTDNGPASNGGAGAGGGGGTSGGSGGSGGYAPSDGQAGQQVGGGGPDAPITPLEASAGGSGGAPIDGSSDGPPDASLDGSPDASLDGSPDAPRDVAPDAPRDVAPDSRDGGDAADVAVGPITVSGTVVDAYRLPYPNVTVNIGPTTKVTDALGHFVVNGVTPPYDVKFVIAARKEGWVFEGLTRPDPTLQVDSTAAERSQALSITAPLSCSTYSYPYAHLAFGAPGVFHGEDESCADSNATMHWAGPAQATGTFHWLVVNEPVDVFTQSYPLYMTRQPVSIGGADAGTLALDLTKAANTTTETNLPTVNLTATVSGFDPGATAGADGYLWFGPGAAAHIFTVSTSATTQQYKVPSHTGFTMSFVAERGFSPQGTAFAHKGNLRTDQGNFSVNLAIPVPPVPTAPAQDAVGVGQGTEFSWTDSARPDLVNVLRIFFNDGSTFRVVTTRKKLVFTPPPGIAVPSQDGSWDVEVHGSYTSTDLATTANGFIDPYLLYGGLEGIDDRDGTHAWSTGVGFTK
jgi:hypothetical protein